MYIVLIVIGVLACAVALYVTLSAGKEVDTTIKQLKEEGNKVHKENQRSKSYERSFSNVRLILLIYGVVFIAAVILLIIFISR